MILFSFRLSFPGLVVTEPPRVLQGKTFWLYSWLYSLSLDVMNAGGC